jgi:hypothetical protein
MTSIVIDPRFCGPPHSANGGYVCGCLAAHIEGPAEVTLLAPPPLARRLDIVATAHGVELKCIARTLATARGVDLALPEVPAVGFSEAQDAASRSAQDDSRHPLPTCFVCGPARAVGDGLRLRAGPLGSRAGARTGMHAAPWVPGADLAGSDGAVAAEFVWAALDCPSGYAGLGARHLGLSGSELILLGRMRARIERRPHPGDQCVIVAWPTGRDGRKLFAGSALLGADGTLLAAAEATWILLDRQVQPGG